MSKSVQALIWGRVRSPPRIIISNENIEDFTWPMPIVFEIATMLQKIAECANLKEGVDKVRCWWCVCFVYMRSCLRLSSLAL